MKQEILKAVVEYCLSEETDFDTMNKISEIISLTAQKKKGRMSQYQEKIFDKATSQWKDGSPTPSEFKGTFRGGFNG